MGREATEGGGAGYEGHELVAHHDAPTAAVAASSFMGAVMSACITPLMHTGRGSQSGASLLEMNMRGEIRLTPYREISRAE